MATQRLISLTAAVLFAAGTGGAAIARSTPMMDVPVSKSVPYGDLDLSSDAGQETLRMRLKAAVRSVCGEDGTRVMNNYAQQQQCKMQAMRHAQQQSAKAIAQHEARGSRMAATNRAIVGN